eukprot:3374267-Ditylum_brightwellii.AAC.2
MASTLFHKFLGDFLREMGFLLLQADQDLWLRKLDQYSGYNFIATHVVDLIIVAKELMGYMTKIEHHFQVRDVTDSLSYYLGNNTMRRGDQLCLSMKNYVKEVLQKYQGEHVMVAKENLPIKPKERPELDESEIVGEEEHKDNQKIIGICQ